MPLLTRAAEWAAGVGAYRDGAEWARLALGHADEHERPALLALRAQLLHGAGEAGAPAAYAEAIDVAPAERVPALRAQQARACLAAGDVSGAEAALEGVQAERPEDLGELILLRGMVAWHAGDWEGARRLAAEADRLAPDPGELADLKGVVAHMDGGWEQHSRRQLTHVWDSPQLAGRVFDAHLCVTEYVLTAGDPYDRVAAFAKRLRAQAHQAGARRGEAFAVTVLGETELFTDNLEAARAHLVEAARLSREVGAVGGESLARMRLGEALLHLGDRAGARAQLEEALELAHISPLAQHLLVLAYGVLLRVPDDSAEALSLIERAETLFDPRWLCRFCPTGYHVAAATVCARAGELERAREFLERAERGADGWLGGPWPAAVAEARAELLLAEGDQGAPLTVCAAPPKATPRRGSCSTSGERAKRWNGSAERRSAPRKDWGRHGGDAAGTQTNTTDSTHGRADRHEPGRDLAETYRDGQPTRDDRLAATVGPIGRYTATHFRVVLAMSVLVGLALGFSCRTSRTRWRAPAGTPPARSRSTRDS